MKKLVIWVFLGFCLPSWGQNPGKPKLLDNFSLFPGSKDPIPIDSSVRIGKLPNGLHYYIRKNSFPANHAEIRFIVHAGSLQEDDDQIGAAHFIAHLAFQGTLHFPKMDLQNLFKRSGIGLNPDQNGRVGFEETTYSFTVPLDSPMHEGDSSSLFFKTFQLIHDWSKNLSFDESTFALVKSSLHSEWRTGWGPNTKIRDNYFPNIFRDSRYGKRLPLGNPKWIDSLSISRIKKYYSDWYSPDLECLIVVGDFDPESVQNFIQSTFSDLKNPFQERVLTPYSIPLHRENRLALVTDKDIPYTLAQWVYVLPKAQMETKSDLAKDLEREILNSMIRSRIQTYIKENPDHLIFANASYIPFLGNLDTYQNQVLVKNGKGIIEGIKALATQSKIWARFGFEQSELDKAKNEIFLEAYKTYQNSQKRNSKSFADSYEVHYLKKTPIPNSRFQYQFIEEILPKIQLSSLNALYKTWFLDDYPYFIISAPEKEKQNLPPGGDILQALRIKPENLIKPKEFIVDNRSLIQHSLDNTSLILKDRDTSLGVYTYRLKNGMEVCLKPSRVQANQIVFSGIRRAGTASFSDNQYLQAVYAFPFIQSTGLGGYKADSLKKRLATKTIQINPFMDEYSLGLLGKTQNKDLETAFQLMNLYFTKPLKDEKEFKNQIEKRASALKKEENASTTFFADTVAMIMSQNNIRNRKIKSSDLEKLNQDSILSIFVKAFSSPSEFHFAFVGDFNLDSMKTYLGKYLGNISSNAYPLELKKDIHEYPSSSLKRVFHHGNNPRTYIRLFYTGYLPYSPGLESQIQFILRCIDSKFREDFKNRKLMGLNFHLNGKVENEFINRYAIEISLACNPDYADSIVSKFQNRIHEWKNIGLDSLTLHKILKETRISSRSQVQDLDHWLYAFNEWFIHRKPLKSSLNPNMDLDFINTERSKEFMRLLFKETPIDLRLVPEK